jgi:hypothetical protein
VRTTRTSRRIGRAGAAAIGALAAMLCAASSAWAAPPSFKERHPDLVEPDRDNATTPEKDARSKRAREAFLAGNAALAAGDFKACEQHFAIVWVLTHYESAAAGANLGLCENRLGFYVDAFEHLTKAKDKYDAAANSGERAVERGKTYEELVVAEAHICSLVISGVPDGAVVTVGPKIRFTAPGPKKLAVYPDDYEIEVRLDGELLHRKPLHMVPGTTYSYAFVPPPPKVEAPVVQASGLSVAWLWAGGASATVFAGLGAGMLGASYGKLSQAAALRAEIGGIFGSQVGACHAPTGALVDLCHRLDATTDDAAIFQYVGVVSLIASGALAATTVAYGLWPRSAGPGGSKPGPAATVAALFVAGPGGAGVRIQGTW